MKTQQPSQRHEEGSVLAITLILLLIMGMTLASYLALSSAQAKSVARSQVWNHVLGVAEAGVEDALQHMNSSPNDFSLNSWGGSGSVFGPRTNILSGGWYTVYIQTNPITTIYATGYINAPISSGRIERAIKVTTQQLPLFNVAFAAQNNINMQGNGAATDSFNSYDPNLSSTNMLGCYDPNETSTNGHAASEQGVVNIGNHEIDGSLYLGPTATYMSDTGQVTGTIFYDYNVQLPPIFEPTSTWLTASATGNDYIFTSADSGRYYQITSLNKNIIVEPGVKVTLMIESGTFNPAYVDIQGAPTNSGTLTIYQRAGTMDLSGNAEVGGTRAENFIYYGEAGVTSIKLAGTSVFVGCIYAPNANLTNAGGGNGVGFIGSCIVGSITMNGHYDFHYDEALGSIPLYSGHVPSSWQEL